MPPEQTQESREMTKSRFPWVTLNMAIFLVNVTGFLLSDQSDGNWLLLVGGAAVLLLVVAVREMFPHA